MVWYITCPGRDHVYYRYYVTGWLWHEHQQYNINMGIDVAVRHWLVAGGLLPASASRWQLPTLTIGGIREWPIPRGFHVSTGPSAEKVRAHETGCLPRDGLADDHRAHYWHCVTSGDIHRALRGHCGERRLDDKVHVAGQRGRSAQRVGRFVFTLRRLVLVSPNLAGVTWSVVPGQSEAPRWRH